MKKNLSLSVSLSAIALLLAQSLIPVSPTALAEAEIADSKTAPAPLASLSDEISVHAARRGFATRGDDWHKRAENYPHSIRSTTTAVP